MRRKVDWVVVALLLVAALVRFPGLGARSLWFDEALSGLIARLSTTQVLTNAAGSSHPPGYYLILHMWRPLAGESEFALRFPSAWFSLAAVALTARLGGELFGRRAARLAALGMALSPFQVYYAQEARMYGLTIALSAGVLWAFLRGVRPDRRSSWWAYGILVALGLYVHYYIALLVLALHVWVALDRSRLKRVIRPLLTADGVAVAAFLPQAAQFFIESSEYLGGLTSWQARPHLLSPLTTVYYLVFGLARPPGAAWFSWIWVGLGLFLVLSLVALVGVWGARWARRAEMWALALSVSVPIGVIWGVSYIAHSIYSERSFALVTPALTLLLVYAVKAPPRRSPVVFLGGALVGLCALGVVFHHLQPDPAKPPVRQAVAAVAREARPGDAVLHWQDASYVPALYYEMDETGSLMDTGQGLWLTPEVYTLFGGRVVPSAGLPSGPGWLVVMPGYLDSWQRDVLAEWLADSALTLYWDRGAVQVYSIREH